MSGKTELLSIARDLKSLADRLIDCAKEDYKEEKAEGKESASVKKVDHKAIVASLKQKMEKY